MNNQTKALSQIASALETLEDARALISDLLIKAPTGPKRPDRAFLQDLHQRVSNAISALPHSGRHTANGSKGGPEDD